MSVGPAFSSSFGNGSGDSEDSPIAVDFVRFRGGEELGRGGGEGGFCEDSMAVWVSVRMGACGICAFSKDFRVSCCSAGTPTVFSVLRLLISTGETMGASLCTGVGTSRVADVVSVLPVLDSGLSLADMVR